jgi:isocitrate/isopropylmalate dehydrogenase
MASRNVTERVEVLEMEVGGLKEWSGRVSAVELQIVQLRTEMRGEFSAVRQEMRGVKDELSAEMRMLREEVLERIAKIGEGAAMKRKRKR